MWVLLADMLSFDAEIFSRAVLLASLTLAGVTIGRCGASPRWGFIDQELSSPGLEPSVHDNPAAARLPTGLSGFSIAAPSPADSRQLLVHLHKMLMAFENQT